MLRAAASNLLGSAVWSVGGRQLAPAAAWAALGGAGACGARSLTAQAAPVDAHAHHAGGGGSSSSEEELAEFREGVRTFAQDFVAPHAAEIDRLNSYPSGFEFWRTAGEWGLHGAPLLDALLLAALMVCGALHARCSCGTAACWSLLRCCALLPAAHNGIAVPHKQSGSLGSPVTQVREPSSIVQASLCPRSTAAWGWATCTTASQWRS